MTLTARLTLIGASALVAAVVAFALPLPGKAQSAPRLVAESSPAGACGCTADDASARRA